MSDYENIADSIMEFAKENLKPFPMSVSKGSADAVTAVAIPQGFKLESVKPLLDQWRTAPERRVGTAKFQTLESLIDHANRFSDEHSVLFANMDRTNPSITAVLNYHEDGAAGAPRFGNHRGLYSFPLSDEWKAWHVNNGVIMSQSDFASFLEDRITDVADPAQVTLTDQARALLDLLGGKPATAGRLLELSRGMAVYENVNVKQAVNLGTGEAQIQYVTAHTDATGAPLIVPNHFLIGIPVFHLGPLYSLPVRLRYRVRDGGIKWFYEIHRADMAFDHAFAEACEKAKADTDLPLFYGSPEGSN